MIPKPVFDAMLKAAWAVALVAIFAGLAVALTRCGGAAAADRDDAGLCECVTCADYGPLHHQVKP